MYVKITKYQYNNTMTSGCDYDFDYGHFYDIEKDEYFMQYKYLKPITSIRNCNNNNNQPTKKSKSICDNMTAIVPYTLVSLISISLTIYCFTPLLIHA